MTNEKLKSKVKNRSGEKPQFLLDPSPIIALPCHSDRHSVTPRSEFCSNCWIVVWMDLSKLIQGRMAVVGRLSENAKVPSILASGALLLIRDKENVVFACISRFATKSVFANRWDHYFFCS